jgi:hypothetical protein
MTPGGWRKPGCELESEEHPAASAGSNHNEREISVMRHLKGEVEPDSVRLESNESKSVESRFGIVTETEASAAIERCFMLTGP